MKSTIKKTMTCRQCGSSNIKARRVTCPLKIGTKQIYIGRVSVRMCIDCHDMNLTKSAKEKIARCMMSYMSMLR